MPVALRIFCQYVLEISKRKKLNSFWGIFMFQVILNNFQKKIGWRVTQGVILFFNFSPFQAILSLFWIFPIFGKINLMGGGKNPRLWFYPKGLGMQNHESVLSRVRGKFFCRFRPNSELILNFLKEICGRGGGRKFVHLEFTKIFILVRVGNPAFSSIIHYIISWLI